MESSMNKFCRSCSPGWATHSHRTVRIKASWTTWTRTLLLSTGRRNLTFGRPEKSNLRTHDRASRKSAKKDRPDKRADRSKERTGRTHERSKRPDRASDRKRPKTSRSDTSSKPRIPESEQCRRPTCRERGNHLNHSHAKCHFADTSTRHPNLAKP